MKKQRHLLADLWESYPDILNNRHTPTTPIPIGTHLANLLAIGPYYCYIINMADYNIFQVSEQILDIHGLSGYPQTLQQVIELIHPDDIDFVIAAEKATIEKMKEIGFIQQLKLKTSYCFRMRVADGTYHLFHHQAIHLTKNEDGQLTTALNIHTDIQHITSVNNKIVLVNGVGDRRDYHQIDLSSKAIDQPIPKLSKREIQILELIASGLNSFQIGTQLFIAEETVRTHRRNLLRKTATTNSSYMIKKCIELGLL